MESEVERHVCQRLLTSGLQMRMRTYPLSLQTCGSLWAVYAASRNHHAALRNHATVPQTRQSLDQSNVEGKVRWWESMAAASGISKRSQRSRLLMDKRSPYQTRSSDSAQASAMDCLVLSRPPQIPGEGYAHSAGR